MKKNLVTAKHKELYKFKILPFIEAKFTVDTWKNRDLVINQSSLANYFNIDRKILADMLKQAELDGLIKFERKVRKFDDEKIDWALNKYSLILDNDEDSKCYSMLQRYINNYMYWYPDFGERWDLVNDYIKHIERQKSPNQLKKEERAKAYLSVYPWTEDIMEKINAERPERLKSKYLAEGKLRESSFLCSTLNPEKDHVAKIDIADLAYRYTVLRNFFGTEDFIECDTNASIYRLSYNLNHKKLLGHDVDVYSEFWKLAGFKGELTASNRDALKLLCMPIFMSNAAKNGYNALLVNKDDMSLSRSEYVRKCAIQNISTDLNLTPREFLDKLAAAMYEFIGTDHFLESEIFIHESNLHLLILNYCLENNIRAVNVYDGFYFVKGTMTIERYNKLYDKMTKLIKDLNKAV